MPSSPFLLYFHLTKLKKACPFALRLQARGKAQVLQLGQGNNFLVNFMATSISAQCPGLNVFYSFPFKMYFSKPVTFERFFRAKRICKKVKISIF